jgi:hypothetical protein
MKESNMNLREERARAAQARFDKVFDEWAADNNASFHLADEDDPDQDDAIVLDVMKYLAIVRESAAPSVKNHAEYTGEYPRGLNDVEPREPSHEMRRWVKSRQIAFAKSHPRISITQSSSTSMPI